MLNSGPAGWAADVQLSVAQYNDWYRTFAPGVFRRKRGDAAGTVVQVMVATRDFAQIDAPTLLSKMGLLPTLRMAACPPLARDRLTGLSGASDSFVGSMDGGKLPVRMPGSEQRRRAALVADTLTAMLDVDLMPWLTAGRAATTDERRNAALVLGDRLATSIADPIVRNEQQERQFRVIASVLQPLGYRLGNHLTTKPLTAMPTGTYQFQMRVMGGAGRTIAIPIDCVVQPRVPRPSRIPILIEAKSAGDFTNVNKRRKEEAEKHRNLQAALGPDVEYLLFLCGYFDTAYLAYEVAAGMDFVWEHRPLSVRLN